MIPIPSPRHRLDGWWRFIAFGVAFAVAAIAFVIWMSVQVGGATVTTAVDDIGEAAAAGIAAVSCGLAGIRTQGRLRRAWILLAASAASWCLGEVVWSVYEVGLGITPVSPSVTDIGFLAAIPLAIAGIVTFAHTARGTSTGLRLWLDRAIVSLSLLYVGWDLGLGSVFSESGGELASRIVTVAYPVGDILIVCFSGSPTPVGHPVPQADITVSLSATVTSKVTDGNSFTEALMLVDEPTRHQDSGRQAAQSIPNSGFVNGAGSVGLVVPRNGVEQGHVHQAGEGKRDNDLLIGEAQNSSPLLVVADRHAGLCQPGMQIDGVRHDCCANDADGQQQRLRIGDLRHDHMHGS